MKNLVDNTLHKPNKQSEQIVKKVLKKKKKQLPTGTELYYSTFHNDNFTVKCLHFFIFW